MSRSIDWRSCSEALGVALLALTLELLLFDRVVSAMDEGHVLQFADLLRKGGELYRDAVLYPLPGAFYLLELAFEAFGPSIRVARWLVVIEFTLFALFSFLLVRPLLSRWGAAASVMLLLLYRMWAFPHWQMYSYSTSSLCVLTLAFFFMARSLESRTPRGLALVGLLLGLGILCKQDYGAASLLALSVVLLLAVASRAPGSGAGRLAPWVWLGAPVALVGLATGVDFIYRGILADALQQTVFAHLRGMQTFEYPALPPLFPLFEQNPALKSIPYVPGLLFELHGPAFLAYRHTLAWDLALKAFYYGPYLLVAGGGARLWLRRSKLRDAQARGLYLRELLLWSWAAAFLLLFTLNRPQDYVHLAVLYWPFLALALVYAEALLRMRGRPGGRAVALLLVPLAGTAAHALSLAWQLRAEHSALLPGERAGVFTTPETARTLDQAVSYIVKRSEPAEPVAIIPYFPLAAFLAERNAPERSSYIIWPVPLVANRDARIVDALRDVELVVYDFTQIPLFPPMEEYSPLVFRYLVDHFELDAVFNEGFWSPMLVGLRRQPPGASAGTSLVSELAGASLRIETPRQPDRSVARSERDAWMQIGVWPFRPSLALRPSRSPARTVLGVPLEVPAASRLRTAVAVHPRRWIAAVGSWVEFELVVVSDGRRDPLFSRRLHPSGDPRDRTWVEVDVSLEDYAGRSVVVELSTRCESPLGQSLDMGGWEIPRLLTSPGS